MVKRNGELVPKLNAARRIEDIQETGGTDPCILNPGKWTEVSVQLTVSTEQKRGRTQSCFGQSEEQSHSFDRLAHTVYSIHQFGILWSLKVQN